MPYRIDPFDPTQHDTKHFHCGSASQDNFLRRTARRQQRDDYTRLYGASEALLAAEPRCCLGFYAINAHTIGMADLPPGAVARAPRTQLIPAVFLSHLAVDQHHQGRGLGRILLVDALQRCQSVQQMLGVRLLLLDVSHDAGEAQRIKLLRFYASMGFRALPGWPDRLFLSIPALSR
ncbi:MAG: GNAT family N-acetyltransferase [Vulcanococcus sp.]|nr:GNAT family N-acetyltransferase [Vulcanococcus sp.]